MPTIRLINLAVVLLVAALASTVFAADCDVCPKDALLDPVAQEAENAKAQLEKLIATYGEELTNADLEGILELYSSDPVFMPEYAPPAVGRAAVHKAYEWVFATLKLNGHFTIQEAEVMGDRAWVRTSSVGRLTVIATGVEADLANTELFLFKRENGAWKIHRYIFTASAPPG